MIIDISDTKTGGNLGYCDHALVEFVVLMNRGQAKRKAGTLNFRKTKFQLVEELVNRKDSLVLFLLVNRNPWFPPRKLPSGTRIGRTLRILSTEHKSSRFPVVRNQESKAREHHG